MEATLEPTAIKEDAELGPRTLCSQLLLAGTGVDRELRRGPWPCDATGRTVPGKTRGQC